MTAQTLPYRPTSLARLTRVQLRATVSTRGGRWFYAAIAALSVAVALLISIIASNVTYSDVLINTMFLLGVLLPIVGILLFTSEWGTRTTLTTFTLAPKRHRIVLAKLGAAVIIGLAASAMLFAVVAGSVAAFAGGGDVWDVSLAQGLQYVGFVVLSMLMGSALGAALLNTPGAIVAFFAVPIAIEMAGLWSKLSSALEWVSQDTTVSRLLDDGLTGSGVAHILVGVGIWAVLPLVIGATRILRQDIA